MVVYISVHIYIYMHIYVLYIYWALWCLRHAYSTFRNPSIKSMTATLCGVVATRLAIPPSGPKNPPKASAWAMVSCRLGTFASAKWTQILLPCRMSVGRIQRFFTQVDATARPIAPSRKELNPFSGDRFA